MSLATYVFILFLSLVSGNLLIALCILFTFKYGVNCSIIGNNCGSTALFYFFTFTFGADTFSKNSWFFFFSITLSPKLFETFMFGLKTNPSMMFFSILCNPNNSGMVESKTESIWISYSKGPLAKMGTCIIFESRNLSISVALIQKTALGDVTLMSKAINSWFGV